MFAVLAVFGVADVSQSESGCSLSLSPFVGCLRRVEVLILLIEQTVAFEPDEDSKKNCDSSHLLDSCDERV